MDDLPPCRRCGVRVPLVRDGSRMVCPSCQGANPNSSEPNPRSRTARLNPPTRPAAPTQNAEQDGRKMTPVALLLVAVAVLAVVAVGLGEMFAPDGPEVIEPPAMQIHPNVVENYVTVMEASQGLQWDALSVSGCFDIPTGPVAVGDKLLRCGGPVVVAYAPTGELLAETHAG